MTPTISSQQKKPVPFFFIFWWVLVNTLGLSVVLTLLSLIDTKSLVFLALNLLAIGGLIGKIQSMVLWRYMQITGWMWLSAFGWAAGIFAGGYLQFNVGGFIGEVLLWFTLGTSIGIIQGFILAATNRMHLVWVLINAFGLTIAGILGAFVIGIISLITGDLRGSVVGFLMTGATYGMITGSYLLWCLYKGYKNPRKTVKPARYLPQFQRYGSELWEDAYISHSSYTESEKFIKRMLVNNDPKYPPTTWRVLDKKTGDVGQIYSFDDVIT